MKMLNKYGQQRKVKKNMINIKMQKFKLNCAKQNEHFDSRVWNQKFDV